MLKALREVAIEEPGTPIVFCSGHLRKVAHTFPNKTSIGVDCWTFQEIAACTDDDLAALGRLMAENLSMIIVPKQCALNIMSLLPKACGDFRTVCTLSTYKRMETRLQAKEEK